jgi:hypothetical protein
MVKKSSGKKEKKEIKKKKETEKKEESGGKSLNDAFSDDDDVEYAKSKPRKIEKKAGKGDIETVAKNLESSLAKAEREVEELTEELKGHVDLSEKKPIQIKKSKPIAEIKKGDKIKVDGLTLEVDAHYVLIDHGTTKEMTIECFDSKTDKDYQLRYFSDQVETTLEFYELEEIIYNRIDVTKIEW